MNLKDMLSKRNHLERYSGPLSGVLLFTVLGIRGKWQSENIKFSQLLTLSAPDIQSSPCHGSTIQDHPKEIIPLLTVKINEVKLHYYESNV